MIQADEDYLEFLKKCGFSNYYGLDGSAILFRVVPRGKFQSFEVISCELTLERNYMLFAFKDWFKD
jgi:hypothetical protein